MPRRHIPVNFPGWNGAGVGVVHIAKDASITFCGRSIKSPEDRNVDPALNRCSTCALEHHKFHNPCPSHNPS